MNVNKNELSGSIPNGAITMLKSLNYLFVGNNNLTGVIPEALADYTMNNIRLVDFSGNNFSGPIPNLTANPSISTVLLDDNKLLTPLEEIEVIFNFMKLSPIKI